MKLFIVSLVWLFSGLAAAEVGSLSIVIEPQKRLAPRVDFHPMIEEGLSIRESQTVALEEALGAARSGAKSVEERAYVEFIQGEVAGPEPLERIADKRTPPRTLRELVREL
jgi:hypothetical protein